MIVVQTKVENSALQLANAANVKNKWNFLYNVKEIGNCKGDGTDETSGIQKTIDTAITHGSKTVMFPPGNYVASSLTGLDQVVLFGDNATLTVGGSSVPVTQLGAVPLSHLYRQAIINGNFDVWQRGTSLTLGNGVASYLADRFYSANVTSGANSTVSRVAITDLDGSAYGLQFINVAIPVNQGRLQHFYTLEAADSYKLAGKTVTFSIKVKGVLAMNQASVIARYNTTETAINGASVSIANVSNVLINNATWTIITFTFTCPNRATLTSSGVIGFHIVCGKTTNEANGDGFIIAQVQINVGNVVLPFQPRSFAEELALCQRYYEFLDSARVRYQDASNSVVFTRDFRPKRIAPTATITTVLGTAISLNATRASSIDLVLTGIGVTESTYTIKLDAEI